MFNLLMNGVSHFCFAPEEGDQGGTGGGGTGSDTGASTGTDTGQTGAQTGTDSTSSGTGDTGTDTGTDTGASQQTGESDWRKEMAGDDEKELERLNRFASKKDVWNSLKEAQRKISSGELKAPLPKDPTPEQLAQYRKDNGIPDKAEGYLEKLPETIKLADEDKALLTPFLNDMLEKNASPAMVHSAIAAYEMSKEQATLAVQKADAQIVAQTQTVLRGEWKGDYDANMTAADAFLTAHYSAEGKNALLGARDADGKPLMHNPEFLRGCAQLGRELAPAGATYGNGMDNLDTIETELATLKGQMGSKSWYTNVKGQERYRQLLDAKARIKKS